MAFQPCYNAMRVVMGRHNKLHLKTVCHPGQRISGRFAINRQQQDC